MGIPQVDLDVSSYIRTTLLFSHPLMYFFSVIGIATFYFFLVPFVYFFKKKAGLVLPFIIIVSLLLQKVLKLLLKQPRPFQLDFDAAEIAASGGYGMPSGHALVAASFWGYLWLKIKNRYVRALAVVMIFFIGLSRVVLGVHTVLQVLAGWCLGLLLVLSAEKVEGMVYKFNDKKNKDKKSEKR